MSPAPGPRGPSDRPPETAAEPRGIVFDFGNVLYRVDYPAMARTLAGERGPDLLEAFVGSPCQRAYESGRADLEDVLAHLGRLGFPADRDRFLAAYLAIFTPVPGMSDLLARLAGRRPLGLLSNTSPEHARRFIERTPEFRRFDAAVYSFDVGCMKPDPRTYRAIADALGMRPEELVYVDDVPAYARGAAAVGMVGVPFTGTRALAATLGRLGFREEADG